MAAEEQVLCAICLCEPQNPLLLSVCRHTFCAVCILACYNCGSKAVPCQTKKIKLSVDPKCPVCRAPFALTPAGNAQFIIQKAEHATKDCELCDQPIPKGNVVEHLVQRCPKAETACPLCAELFQINHFDAHLRTSCTKVPCTCCLLVGPWSFIKAHNENFNVNKMNEASVVTIAALSDLFYTSPQPLETLRSCAKILSHTFKVANGFEGERPDLGAIAAWKTQLQSRRAR